MQAEALQAVLGDCTVDWPSLLSFASFLSVASCSMLSLLLGGHDTVFIALSLLMFHLGREMYVYNGEVRA